LAGTPKFDRITRPGLNRFNKLVRA
jgi:hypothetical protein